MKNLLKLLLIILLISLYACSPKISKYAKYNKVIINQYSHIINDSIQSHIQLFGDYKPILDLNKIKNSFKNKSYLNNKEVLLYAVNTVEKNAELYITVSEKPLKFKNLPETVSLYDTIADKITLTFIKLNTSETPFKRINLNENYAYYLPTVSEIISETSSSNKYLKTLNEINLLSTYERDSEWPNLQHQLTYSSFLGENNPYYQENINRLFQKFSPTINDTIFTVLKEKAITKNVPKAIANLASDHRIIMINENHFFPKDRLLLIDLLPLLKENGFTHLALESLTKSEESNLNKSNAYPTQNSGFYLREQNFSNAIRLAKKLDFELIAYESDSDDRENGQAINLYNKTWANNPDAKVIVWAGLSHIYEKDSRGKKYLAKILKEKYNINPLTISQTQLVPYENNLNSTYSLIKSSKISSYKKVYTDYLLVNKRNHVLPESVVYKNSYNQEIQLSLFYKNEIVESYQYQSRIPYFTTFIAENNSAKIPTSNGNSLLVIYDKYGNVLKNETY